MYVYTFLQFLTETTSILEITKKLSAVHHARWMGSAIYILKMFICRDLFDICDSARIKK